MTESSSFFDRRSGQILIWMLLASQMAVLLGSMSISLSTTIGLGGSLTDLGALFFAVTIVAGISINLVVIPIAYPIRLVWKRKLSTAFMACGSALAGGLIYTAPMVFTAYEAFVIESGVQIGDGSVNDAVQGVSGLFFIGAFFGGIFGCFYGILEISPDNAKTTNRKFEGDDEADAESGKLQ